MQYLEYQTNCAYWCLFPRWGTVGRASTLYKILCLHDCQTHTNTCLGMQPHMRRSYSAAQMRFPTALVRPDKTGEWRLAAHHATLLDGEMVVDQDLNDNLTRRYLAYDCMAVNSKSLAGRPWRVLHLLPPAALLLCSKVGRGAQLTSLWSRMAAGGVTSNTCWPSKLQRVCIKVLLHMW